MASTTEHTVTAGAWTEIASGANASNALIQRGTLKAVEIHVGEIEPGASSPGIVLAGNEDFVLPIYGLQAADRVYARAIGATAVVTVMAT